MVSSTSLQRVKEAFTETDWDSLTDRQRFFVAEYIHDFNATRAARVAGYKQPQNECVKLMRSEKIAAAVEFVIQQRSVRTLIRADDVLKRWFAIATADPSELIAYQVECCRHCHGIEHRYQWYEVEFQHACEKYDEERQEVEDEGRVFKKKPPDERGGFGFDPNKKPNPNCPHCSGRGVERTVVTDTRDLSPQAKLLYAGVKVTKEGIQVLMQDQAKALEQVARHLGMFDKDAPLVAIQNNVQNNGVRTITRRIIDPKVIEEEAENE